MQTMYVHINHTNTQEGGGTDKPGKRTGSPVTDTCIADQEGKTRTEQWEEEQATERVLKTKYQAKDH